MSDWLVGSTTTFEGSRSSLFPRTVPAVPHRDPAQRLTCAGSIGPGGGDGLGVPAPSVVGRDPTCRAAGELLAVAARPLTSMRSYGSLAQAEVQARVVLRDEARCRVCTSPESARGPHVHTRARADRVPVRRDAHELARAASAGAVRRSSAGWAARPCCRPRPPASRRHPDRRSPSRARTRLRRDRRARPSSTCP